MTQPPPDDLWDSFWAVHASSTDPFHRLLWHVRFLFSRAYARKIFGYLEGKRSANLLEIGCGSARTMRYLDDHLQGGRCFGLDLSLNAVRLLRRLSPGFRTAVADAFRLPLASERFDAVFSIGLIEHFTREEAAGILREKIRVTTGGGVVGIVVPLRNSVYNLIVRKAFGRHWPFGHENPFHPGELAAFMQDLGLQDVTVHTVYGSVVLGLARRRAPAPVTGTID